MKGEINYGSGFMVNGSWLMVTYGSRLMVTTYQYGIREEGI